MVFADDFSLENCIHPFCPHLIFTLLCYVVDALSIRMAIKLLGQTWRDEECEMKVKSWEGGTLNWWWKCKNNSFPIINQWVRSSERVAIKKIYANWTLAL